MLSINPSSMSRGKRVFSMYRSGHANTLNPPFSGWSWLNGLLISPTRNSRVSIPIFLLTYLYFSHARGMNTSLNFCISVDMPLVFFDRRLSLEDHYLRTISAFSLWFCVLAAHCASLRYEINKHVCTQEVFRTINQSDIESID
jgi:hypothetical protein